MPLSLFVLRSLPPTLLLTQLCLEGEPTPSGCISQDLNQTKLQVKLKCSQCLTGQQKWGKREVQCGRMGSQFQVMHTWAGHWESWSLDYRKVAAQTHCSCEQYLEGRSGEEMCVPISSRSPLVIVHPKWKHTCMSSMHSCWWTQLSYPPVWCFSGSAHGVQSYTVHL